MPPFYAPLMSISGWIWHFITVVSEIWQESVDQKSVLVMFANINLPFTKEKRIPEIIWQESVDQKSIVFCKGSLVIKKKGVRCNYASIYSIDVHHRMSMTLMLCHTIHRNNANMSPMMMAMAATIHHSDNATGSTTGGGDKKSGDGVHCRPKWCRSDSLQPPDLDLSFDQTRRRGLGCGSYLWRTGWRLSCWEDH